MSVVMMLDNPTGEQAVYETLRAKLEIEQPLGGTVHIAGPSPTGGWRVIEIWDSAEEAGRFLRERFAPALADLGVDGPPPTPEFWPVHSYLVAGTT